MRLYFGYRCGSVIDVAYHGTLRSHYDKFFEMALPTDVTKSLHSEHSVAMQVSLKDKQSKSERWGSH